jgi:heavy metal translocating P-type ATPase
VNCAHCGLPCPRGSAAASFCCSGCFLAHRLRGADLAGAPDRLFARVVLAAFLAMGVMVFSLSLYGALLDPGTEGVGEAASALRGVLRLGAMLFALPVFALLGLPLWDAVVTLRRFLSSEALVLVGASAALAASVWNTLRGGGEVWFDTATMVLLLFSLGRWLEVRARERARDELGALAAEREPLALRLAGAAEESVPVAALARGDRVRVRPGECVPVDGRVREGRSFVDASALTGEEVHRSVGPGARVLAGTRLVDGSLVIEAEAVGGERVRDAVARLLAEALASRAGCVRLADRLAAVLLPLVLVLAVLTPFLHWDDLGPEGALLAGLSVVLISCPCALGIAVPLAFWTALGAAWRAGVLVRGGEVLERLARARRAWFDKTGTLTVATPELAAIEPAADRSEREVLALATALELGSEHPLARGVRAAWSARGEGALPAVEDFRALPGVGVEGRVAGSTWRLQRAPERGDGHTRVELSDGAGGAAGVLVFRARLAAGARESIAALRARGLELRVLTGDQDGPAQALARELALLVESGLSPADKLARVRAGGAGTLFVGDGLNDAAALAAADVGVSVAGGSATSLDAAAVNLLRPGLDGLVELLDFSRSAVRTARFNLLWACVYNAAGLGLAVAGRLSPIFAAFAMVASSVFVVLNSARLRRMPAGLRAEPRAIPSAHPIAG